MDGRLFKILGRNGETVNGGSGRWHLPLNGKPGKWMPPIEGKLEACFRGYHLCRVQDLVHWLGPTMWIAERKGKRIDDDSKVVVRQARLIRKLETWNDRTASLFACDCAEEALMLIDEPDRRSLDAVRVARLYAVGEASGEELKAARSAAWSAARSAAGSAAGSAAWSAAGSAPRSGLDQVNKPSVFLTSMVETVMYSICVRPVLHRTKGV